MPQQDRTGIASSTTQRPTPPSFVRRHPPASAETGRTDRSRDLECYRCGGRGHYQKDCPNQKRFLYSTQTVDYKSLSDEEENVLEESAELPDEVIRPSDHDTDIMHYALVTRRVLSVQEGGPLDQRENLFHSRCHMQHDPPSIIRLSDEFCIRHRE